MNRGKIQKIIFSRNPNNSSTSLLGDIIFWGLIWAIGSTLMVAINLTFWRIYQRFGAKFIHFLLIVIGLVILIIFFDWIF